VSQIGGSNGAQELQKVLARSCRKSIGRMGHDVGVHPLGKMKPNGTAAWIGIGIVVWDHRNAGRVRKAYRRWSRWPTQVGSPAEPGCFRRRREGSLQHDAFGMSRSKAGM